MASSLMTTANHHIVLSNPFAQQIDSDDDSSEYSSSSSPHTPTGTHHHHGLRAQLTHLLPRHAFFHVLVVVHQITNIPLVTGEFALKWKFKNVHAAPGVKSGTGLLSMVKARRKAKKDKHRATDTLVVDESSSQRTTSIDGRSLWSGKSSSSSSSSSSGNTTTTPSLISSTASSTPSLLADPAQAPTTPARGQTPFLKLKEHGVTWEHTLSILIKMDVDRDPQSLLLPCPLKLAVLQRDPAKPDGRPTRFGVVNLDLAQYACKGEVTRRYLLRESKTNATLKLSTHLTHLPTVNSSASSTSAPTSANSSTSASSSTSTSTTTNTFTAPPLPQGEILNGISTMMNGLGIIGEDDVYRIRPKGLDLYGPYYDQEDLELDLLGRRVTPPPTDLKTYKTRSENRDKDKDKTKRSRSRSRSRTRKQADKPSSTSSTASTAPAPTDPPKRATRERSNTHSFDPSRLPLAYGPKTTETLIEALFNPVRTTHATRESPFTVYVPKDKEGGGRATGANTAATLSPVSPPVSFINTASPPRTPSGGGGVNVSARLTTTATSPPAAGRPPLVRASSLATTTSPSTKSSSNPGSTPSSPSTFSVFTPSPPSISASTTTTTASASTSSSRPPSRPTSPTPLPPSLTRSSTSKSLSARLKGGIRTKHRRAGSSGGGAGIGAGGIGAGLGIMGLGLGMGVGMGVRVGVSGGGGGGGEVEAEGRAEVEVDVGVEETRKIVAPVPGPELEQEQVEVVDRRRTASEGSSLVDVSGAGARVKGVKAWLKKKRAEVSLSRPGTPVER